MSHESDFSALDRPAILSIIFHPRKDPYRADSNPDITDHFIPVGEDVAIGCRFYRTALEAPTILYFHGNGETVGDHDGIAPYYNRLGANLMVADYRGYGMSSGSPTISAMYKDAHVIFKSVTQLLMHEGYSDRLFLMGRSLGSAPVAELAYHYQDQLNGLVIESGFADSTRLMAMASMFGVDVEADQFAPFSNLNKIKTIRIPTLIIHGELDDLVPVENGKDLYSGSPSEDKKLLIIPDANHNDILYQGLDAYFGAIKELIGN